MWSMSVSLIGTSAHQQTHKLKFVDREAHGGTWGPEYSLQCRHILGGRNLVRVRHIVVATIFDFMTVEDLGE